MATLHMVRVKPLMVRWGRNGLQCMGLVNFEVRRGAEVLLRLPTSAPCSHPLSVASLRMWAEDYLRKQEPAA